MDPKKPPSPSPTSCVNLDLVVMKASVRANRSAMLDAEEASLRARLPAILPGAAAGGAQLFVTPYENHVMTYNLAIERVAGGTFDALW